MLVFPTYEAGKAMNAGEFIEDNFTNNNSFYFYFDSNY
jgi:hypothetical protein